MQLHFKSLGQGPPLIILHGLFGSLDNWMTHARTLASDFTVFLVDQRNHGKSPHSEAWNYQLMAEDLYELMDREAIFSSHILGHSMGGKTAIQFAMLYPERIDKLVIADIGVKAYVPHHVQIIKAMNSVDLSQVSSRKEVDEQLAISIEDIGIRQFLLKGLGRNDAKEFAWKFNLKVLTANYPEVLKQIDLLDPFDNPTFFIHGGRSNYILPKDIAGIQSFFPSVEFYEIPEAGHWLHAEAPEVFITKVREFLID
ncbi:MAG: alpha/beta fold hydrolase [Bacteroidota bacterium]